MAEYHKIEYRIDKSGKLSETVIDISGSSCTAATSSVEKALGEVESQELLPEYYEDPENITTEETQFLTEK